MAKVPQCQTWSKQHSEGKSSSGYASATSSPRSSDSYLDQILDEAAVFDQVTCTVCCEDSNSKDRSYFLKLYCCDKVVCRRCLQQSRVLNSLQCPAALPPHPLDSRDVCGSCTDTVQWIAAEQDMLWEGTGRLGLRCCGGSCHGVVLLPNRVEAGPWQAPSCPNCAKVHCGRCHHPWRANGHRCQDLQDTDARAERDQAARFTVEEVLRADGHRCQAGCGALLRQHFCCFLRPRKLHKVGQFQQCPHCRVMTERDGGCNMIFCTNCRREWCFSCGRGEGYGCTHFRCSLVPL